MAMRLAGAALAAVVGACALVGGVERAEAAPVYQVIDLDLSNSFGPTSHLEFKIGANLTPVSSGSGQLQYVNNGGSKYYFDLFDPRAAFTISISDSGSGSKIDLQFSASQKKYTYCDQFNCGDVFNTLDTFASIITGQRVSLDQSFSLTGASITSATGGGNVFEDGYDTFNSRDFGTPLQISYQVVPTPLPGAAPLFAIALTGLGGIGYARRRRSAAA